jgi:hypothetical protein
VTQRSDFGNILNEVIRDIDLEVEKTYTLHVNGFAEVRNALGRFGARGFLSFAWLRTMQL